jgi:hypothetical protein
MPRYSLAFIFPRDSIPGTRVASNKKSECTYTHCFSHMRKRDQSHTNASILNDDDMSGVTYEKPSATLLGDVDRFPCPGNCSE